MIFLLGISFQYGKAQDRETLESKRKQILKEIETASNTLKSTQKDKRFALKEYLVLQQQAENRQNLVENAQQSVEVIQTQIDSTLQKLDTTQVDLDNLTEEYGTLVRYAYRLKLNDGWATFLFSAKGFNDAFLRWRYIRQFEQTRNRQIKLLQQKLAELEIYRQDLERKKAEKDYLLETVSEQNRLLNNELVEQDQLIKKLDGNEKKLAKELKAKRKAQRELKRAIENIIEAELAKTTTKVDASANNSSASKLTGISADFNKARGNLAWPVSKGRIVQRFGRQSHPDLESVQITNNGIDIATKAGEMVNSAFSGRVLSVQYIPGFKFTVIVQHGIFYTVYSNLEKVAVKLNDQVVQGQKLGNMALANKVFHFEVWQQRKKLNPVHWLK